MNNGNFFINKLALVGSRRGVLDNQIPFIKAAKYWKEHYSSQNCRPESKSLP